MCHKIFRTIKKTQNVFFVFSDSSGSSIAHLPRTELAPEYAEGSGIEKDKQQLT
jgi:hypothetical protein